MPVRDATPALLTREYWTANRCPWCGSAGMFMHRTSASSLLCDTCGIEWPVVGVATKLALVLVSLGRTP